MIQALAPHALSFKKPECSVSSSLQRSVVMCEVQPRSVRPCRGGAPGVGAGPQGTCHRHGHCALSRDEPESLRRCAAKPPSKQGVKMLCTLKNTGVDETASAHASEMATVG